MSLHSVNVTAQAVAASTVQTLATVLASANKSVRLVRWGVSFNGADVAKAPIRVELLRLTSNGTSTSYTPKKIDPTSDAVMASGRTSFTAEPVAGDVLEVHYLSPAGGGIVEVYAPDERINVAPAGAVGVRVLASDAVNANVFLIFDE